MTAFVPGIDETDLKRVIMSLQQLASGRSNATGTVTLVTSSTTTTVTPTQSGIISSSSQIIITPTTANAATEIGNGTIYVSTVGKDTFTLTHANSATTGRTFSWAVLG